MITKQIVEALDLLVDYPGINDYVNIAKAKEFLEWLDENITKIPEKDPSVFSIVNHINEKFTTSLEDWKDSLNDVGMMVWETDENEDVEGVLISGGFYGEPSSSDVYGSFKFKQFDVAEVLFYFEDEDREDCVDKTGTWLEIFKFLAKYYEKYLAIPEKEED